MVHVYWTQEKENGRFKKYFWNILSHSYTIAIKCCEFVFTQFLVIG